MLWVLPIVSCHAYIPSQLLRYQSTNICDKCDLTRVAFPVIGSKKNKDKDYVGSTITQSYLTESSFTAVNLSNAAFKGVNFARSTITNSDFSSARFSKVFLGYPLLFNCNFDQADFINTSFKFSDLSHSNFNGAHLHI